MFHHRLFPSILAGIALAATQNLSAMAQPWPGNPAQNMAAPIAPAATLRDPLINGAATAPAFIPPAAGSTAADRCG